MPWTLDWTLVLSTGSFPWPTNLMYGCQYTNGFFLFLAIGKGWDIEGSMWTVSSWSWWSNRRKWVSVIICRWEISRLVIAVWCSGQSSAGKPGIYVDFTLIRTTYLNNTVDKGHHFMTTVFPNSSGLFHYFTLLIVLPQSANFPDHNPIKHLWDMLDRKSLTHLSIYRT